MKARIVVNWWVYFIRWPYAWIFQRQTKNQKENIFLRKNFIRIFKQKNKTILRTNKNHHIRQFPLLHFTVRLFFNTVYFHQSLIVSSKCNEDFLEHIWNKGKTLLYLKIIQDKLQLILSMVKTRIFTGCLKKGQKQKRSFLIGEPMFSHEWFWHFAY